MKHSNGCGRARVRESDAGTAFLPANPAPSPCLDTAGAAMAAGQTGAGAPLGVSVWSKTLSFDRRWRSTCDIHIQRPQSVTHARRDLGRRWGHTAAGAHHCLLLKNPERGRAGGVHRRDGEAALLGHLLLHILFFWVGALLVEYRCCRRRGRHVVWRGRRRGGHTPDGLRSRRRRCGRRPPDGRREVVGGRRGGRSLEPTRRATAD
mmetsp:Transcript_62362/g.185543  ORF Transcript_62362/g.185543 Transcript_62362/m.185543 type:complete len:206 (+) Transcript_62362:438-1055(+)|eukprot:3061421-Prymnesium_polylepis.2